MCYNTVYVNVYLAHNKNEKGRKLFMRSFLLVDTSTVFGNILGVFSKMGEFISYDMVLIGSMIAMVLVLVGSIIAARSSYEFRLLHCVIRMNRYFAKNPYITDENLVTVNNMMKQVPYVPRYCWQEYMLNRDKFPSEYMSTVACVDQPIKTSSYNVTTRVAGTLSCIVAIVALLFNFMHEYWDVTKVGATASQTIVSLFNILLAPVVVLLIGYIFITILNLYKPKTVKDLYTAYHEFERYINKACSTMPAFVDYEILFTPREIAKGIPVLQEYLEKRAIQEQKDAEEAQVNSVKFEDFNFDELGVENALLLERAMSESEKYFNIKRNLTERITAKEQELYNFQKKFDEVTKEFERKAQASRENLAQINEQMNNTTIKIEVNYQKKRYNEEQQRLQTLEKDYEQATIRFKKQQDEIVAEVKKYNDEIATRKKMVEDAMMAEGKTYANKIFGQINKAVFAQNEPVMKELQDEKGRLEQMVEDMNATIEKQNMDIEDRNEKLKVLEKDLNVKLAELEAINNVKQFFSSAQFRKNMNDLRRRGVVGDEEMENVSLVDANNQAQSLINNEPASDNSNSIINDLNEHAEDINNADTQQIMNNAEAVDNGYQVIGNSNDIEQPQENVNANVGATDEDAKESNTTTDEHNIDFSDVNDVQRQIDEANKNYIDSQNDLQNTIDNLRDINDIKVYDDVEQNTVEDNADNANSTPYVDVNVEAPAVDTQNVAMENNANVTPEISDVVNNETQNAVAGDASVNAQPAQDDVKKIDLHNLQNINATLQSLHLSEQAGESATQTASNANVQHQAENKPAPNLNRLNGLLSATQNLKSKKDDEENN